MGSEMTQCRLLHISAAEFQGVLQHLSSHDHASLRQVSRAVCKQTTQLLPCITLRLSASSSTQQLQQWYQATKQLQHVAAIHIHITNEVSGKVFELAMQLLSQRSTPVTELHLLAENLHHSTTGSPLQTRRPCIQSLQPLQHVLTHLRILVVHNLAVQNLPDDIQQLAAAAAPEGWSLQTISLIDIVWIDDRDGEVLWAEFLTALLWLPRAFSSLTAVDLQIPQLKLPSAQGAAAKAAAIAAAIDSIFQNDEPSTSMVLRNPKSNRTCNHHLNMVAAVASVANAVLQLKCLQKLKVINIPDIWRPHTPSQSEPSQFADELQASFSYNAVATAQIAPASKAAVLDAALRHGQLPSASAAAAAFITLDDLCCWLLQQHCQLRQLHISTDNSWGVSWHQQCDTSNAAATTATKPLGQIVAAYREASPQANDGSSSGSSSKAMTLSDSFKHLLCHYSSPPASSVMGHITRLQVSLGCHEVQSLDELLGDLSLGSLKHLEVSLWDNHVDPTMSRSTLMDILAAAAKVPGLQSFAIDARPIDFELSDDVLLPLTAAGTLSSSLKKLKLNWGHTNGSFDCSWHQGLRQLQSLRELSITHRGHLCNYHSENDLTMLKLLVDSLPTSLQVLEGYMLEIVGSNNDDDDNDDAAAGAAEPQVHLSGVTDSVTGSAGSDEQEELYDGTAAGGLPKGLASLRLCRCQLSSPGILASDQLHELTFDATSWLGGWAAAAAAWPNVTKLVWRFDPTIMSSSSSSDQSVQTNEASVETRAGAERCVRKIMQDISAGFKHLRYLAVGDVPWLSVEIMQPIVQYLNMMRHIRLSVSYRDFVRLFLDKPQDASGNDDLGIDGLGQWLQKRLPWTSVTVD